MSSSLSTSRLLSQFVTSAHPSFLNCYSKLQKAPFKQLYTNKEATQGKEVGQIRATAQSAIGAVTSRGGTRQSEVEDFSDFSRVLSQSEAAIWTTF